MNIVYMGNKRVKFKCTAAKATRVLDLIHNDLFGKIPKASLGKSMYYISFVDDVLTYTWVYFIIEKSEALAENEFKRKIKVLRTNNSRVYFPINQFYVEKGNARQNTIQRIPQHNAIAERLNQTLMEKARCMQSWAVLEPEF